MENTSYREEKIVHVADIFKAIALIFGFVILALILYVGGSHIYGGKSAGAEAIGHLRIIFLATGICFATIFAIWVGGGISNRGGQNVAHAIAANQIVDDRGEYWRAKVGADAKVEVARLDAEQRMSSNAVRMARLMVEQGQKLASQQVPELPALTADWDDDDGEEW